MNKEELLEALVHWNIWRRKGLGKFYPRERTDSFLKWIDSPKAKILKGVRRAGKSTLLFLLIEKLIEKGRRKEAILYINLEEPIYS